MSLQSKASSRSSTSAIEPKAKRKAKSKASACLYCPIYNQHSDCTVIGDHNVIINQSDKASIDVSTRSSGDLYELFLLTYKQQTTLLEKVVELFNILPAKLYADSATQ